MLASHLSQARDGASRRTPTIDAQVRWILEMLPTDRGARVLDLACGPGLYANRLARLGHSVHGVDFGPAAIQHAVVEAEEARLNATYELGDIRTADYGSGYDLAMLIYGEFNVFRRPEALALVAQAHAALRPGGVLLIEPHTFEYVRSRGMAAPAWSTQRTGLFSERPHLLLEENFWEPGDAVAVHRWYVVDAATGEVTRHADAMQAYIDAEYVELLRQTGFDEVRFHSDWPAAPGQEGSFHAITARR